MEFIKFEAPENNSIRIVHCSDCGKSCDETNEQSLKKSLSKATGG